MSIKEELKNINLKDIHQVVLDLEKERSLHIKALGIILRLIQINFQRIDKKELCKKIVSILLEETDFDNVSILLFDHNTQMLKLMAASGKGGFNEKEYNRELSFKKDQGIAWEVYESQEPKFLPDTINYEIKLYEHVKSVPGSLICLPISSIGVLNLSSLRPQKFTNHIKRNFIIIGQVIAQILQGYGARDFLSQSHFHIQNMVDSGNREVEMGSENGQTILEHLRLTLEEAPQGICILDKNGDVVKVNKALCQQLQTQESDLKEHGIGRFFLDAPTFLKLAKALKGDSFKKFSKIRLIRPDASTFVADLFYHPVKDKKEEKKGGILFVHDLSQHIKDSEQKIREEKLRALGSMAAGIAHDFNNLLMAILGNVELLKMKLKGTPYEKRLNNIELCVNDGAKTIKRIQTFVKGKRGNVNGAERATYIAPVINEAIEFTKPLWKDNCQKKGIEISIKTNIPDDLLVNISEYELREVIVNLLINAIDAMPNGGTITINGYRKKNQVIIEVSDTGVGMEADIKAHIFDPYFSTKDTGSSGLGLSIVYGIISNAGGSIECHSEKGLGTKFEIYLPCASKRTNSGEEKSSSKNNGKRVLKILTIDDEIQIIELICLMLEKLGHKVKGCTDPQKALDLMSKEDFDLILTDLGMPSISGWDIAKAAKDINKKTKVTLMTGWGASYKDEDLSNKGIDALLSKPFKMNDLLRVISNLFPENQQP